VQLEVKRCEVLVRFALMHLIATNTSVWLRTLVNEIMFEYEHLHHDDHYDDHATAANTTPGQSVTLLLSAARLHHQTLHNFTKHKTKMMSLASSVPKIGLIPQKFNELLQ